MHLYAFIATLIPTLVAMVTPLCPLCTGVPQMNCPIPQSLSQNETLDGCRLQLDLWPFVRYFCLFWHTDRQNVLITIPRHRSRGRSKNMQAAHNRLRIRVDEHTSY